MWTFTVWSKPSLSSAGGEIKTTENQRNSDGDKHQRKHRSMICFPPGQVTGSNWLSSDGLSLTGQVTALQHIKDKLCPTVTSSLHMTSGSSFTWGSVLPPAVSYQLQTVRHRFQTETNPARTCFCWSDKQDPVCRCLETYGGLLGALGSFLLRPLFPKPLGGT